MSNSIHQIASDQASQDVARARILTLEKSGATFKRIADELSAIAFSRIDDYMTVAPGGEITAIPFDEIKGKRGGKRKMAALKKVKEHSRITESADGEKIWKDSRIEFELYDKLEALQYLCRLRGDEPAKELKHSGSIDLGRPLTDEERAALAEELGFTGDNLPTKTGSEDVV